jgi:hypothetical protein
VSGPRVKQPSMPLHSQDDRIYRLVPPTTTHLVSHVTGIGETIVTAVLSHMGLSTP